MSRTINAKIYGKDREYRRIRIGDEIRNRYGHQAEEKKYSTGIILDAVYAGRKWFVAQFESIWDNGRGSCVGTYYIAYDMSYQSHRDVVLRLCDILDIDAPAACRAEEI